MRAERGRDEQRQDSGGGSGGGSSREPGGEPDLGELMHAAFRGLRRGWAAQLAPFEMTPFQFRALAAVAGHGHHAHGHHGGHGGERLREDPSAPGLRLKDIAELLRIAPRSASEVVDQLEAKGLVVRGPDPEDRRATRIELSDAGRQLREDVRQVRRQQSGDYFSVLSAADRAELARLLGQLARHPEY